MLNILYIPNTLYMVNISGYSGPSTAVPPSANTNSYSVKGSALGQNSPRSS